MQERLITIQLAPPINKSRLKFKHLSALSEL